MERKQMPFVVPEGRIAALEAENAELKLVLEKKQQRIDTLLAEQYTMLKHNLAEREGWQLVPKEPIWFLEFAREWDFTKGYGNKFMTKFFEAMLAAAPNQEEK